MKKNVQRAIFIVLLFCGYIAQAQNTGSISGKVINAKDKKPVDFATIAVKSLKDSSVVASGQTNPDGSFSFKGIAPGKYRIYSAFLGLKTATKDIEVAKAAVNAGEIAMSDDGVDLKDVNVTATIPIVVKKDTIEFDAKSIKVRENAVVEDLLKKVPGVEVAKDGSIKAQGETITKVKVDGKEFFGNDPLLATKNLPADMVDKIQVIDELSEQAQFTGIDDGTRNKILNITTKSGMKHGYFGNSTVGYGSNDRYDASLNVNKFDEDRQISFIGQFNNVNKQNFGQGGGVGNGFGGGGGRGGGGFGGGGGGSSAGGNGGITNTNAAGLNFADTYKDGTQFQASYFFNKATSELLQNSRTQNLLGTGTTDINQKLDNTTDRINHRFNFMVDTKIDPSLSIKIQPNVTYTETDGNSVTDYTRNFITSLTEGLQRNTTTAATPAFSNNLLVRKSFKRRGRTLSLNVSTSINDNNGTNLNYRDETITTGTSKRDSLTNQLNNTSSHSINNTTRLVYTEPLNKTLSVEFNYQNGYSNSDSQRDVLNYNPLTLQYDLVDNTFSNIYNNRTLTNAAGVSLTTTEKKYNWNIGVAAQQTNRVNTNLTTGLKRTQNFINITPSAQFRYNFSNRKRLFINYRGSTTQPSIDQIQPIPDNTNSQTIYVGNPALKPSFNNQLRINFNNFNIENGRFFFAGLNLTQTFNSIGNSVAQLPSGIQQVSYINVDGVYAGNANATWSLPLMAERKLTLNISGNGAYNRNVNYIVPQGGTTSVKNITNTYTISNGYKLVTNVDKFDLTGGITGSYTNSSFSAQQSANTQFYTINPSFDVSYVLPANIRLAIDIDYFRNFGGGDLYNQEYTILNPYISRQFFKNRGTFKFSVNDALNQNTGVSRTATGTSIQDVNFNVLKRYYMLSFTYSLTRIGGRTMSGDMQMPGQRGGGGGQRIRM
ncbi:TonB-dependent receptor family protein [Pedobacter sp. ISL-68]|uniref:outer membrane beta-barrel family protein n=1 Tax=unclassified Pedobacter TaxID=2628915 RepID=UPI001BE770DF|nr:MULTISPECIES: outer membrane beta-barrel family protein [unclassified Pedobacter]MBT2562335.1 TonB-dependent receptor family protein [Pedobacter sp. ISL-64]MBT2588894.1 TonB-dependent receptor family protein [Pedobacter sp. ISL-68]